MTASPWKCDRCGLDARAVYDTDETGPFDIVCDECGWEAYVPGDAKARTRIGKLREIDRTGMAARIDGHIVDIVTAGLLVKVYDALSPASREMFGKPSLERLVDLAWKVAR